MADDCECACHVSRVTCCSSCLFGVDSEYPDATRDGGGGKYVRAIMSLKWAGINPQAAAEIVDLLDPMIRADAEVDAEADTRRRIASGIRALHGNYMSGHLCTDAEMHDLLERCEGIARGESDG